MIQDSEEGIGPMESHSASKALDLIQAPKKLLKRLEKFLKKKTEKLRSKLIKLKVEQGYLMMIFSESTLMLIQIWYCLNL